MGIEAIGLNRHRSKLTSNNDTQNEEEEENEED